MKLPYMFVPIAHVYAFSVLVMAVELIELGCGCRLCYRAKALRWNTIERTIQEHALRIGIVSALVVWQTSYHGILAQSLEGAIVEDVAMILLRVTNPHECTITAESAMNNSG